jgi:hypothetical protein
MTVHKKRKEFSTKTQIGNVFENPIIGHELLQQYFGLDIGVFKGLANQQQGFFLCLWDTSVAFFPHFKEN